MFILRKFLGEEMVESNTILGDSYNIVYKVSNPAEFQKCYQVVFGTDDPCEDGDKTVAFITYADGSRTMALYKVQASYIMTDNGSTFSGRLTMR